MQPRKKILVTGSNGQLGSEIGVLANRYPQFEFLATSREQLPITNEGAVNDFFEKHRPDFCINCAAYTAVDKAEDTAEFDNVSAVNKDAVSHLAKACARHNARLVHISTDYVFDGTATEPYKETDATNPVSVYGTTKREGEIAAMAQTDAIIIRTAWVYAPFGNNFVKTIMRLMKERPQISVVSDQYGTPTYAADLAQAILAIIASGNWKPGIYHYSNKGKINWYEFALAIKEIIKSDCEVKAIPTLQYPTPAKRPAWSVLDKTKIQEAFGLEIPEWKDSLKACIHRM
ncbi:dTDP-4-dehydrorhamnose reductase [Niabella insulamsoli]|uniref:dTDP-4-dehydrorhamnose reductase n=1 Tax=Niabella insulamsoli TaxID=3144874 RepID=UPI0031FBF452